QRIGKAARSPAGIVDETGAEQQAERNGDKHGGQTDRPTLRQESGEQKINQKRQQQHQRQITEVTFAEDKMLQCEEIPQPGSAIIKHALAAAQRIVKITVEKIPQDDAADAVVEHAVVAAVEGPHAAEEARVID